MILVYYVILKKSLYFKIIDIVFFLEMDVMPAENWLGFSLPMTSP